MRRFLNNQLLLVAAVAVIAALATSGGCGQDMNSPSTQTILYTDDHVPQFTPSSQQWTSDLCQHQTFLAHEDPKWEWTPVLSPTVEYETDADLSGVSGTVVADKSPISGIDLPFTHPFGRDYEFFVAPDSKYNVLLGPSNLGTGAQTNPSYKDAYTRAGSKGLKVPGVLGIETDNGFVPPAHQVQDGDRVVAFGRWIADCGHDDFHTEIHPPLLFASGHATSATQTAVQVVSRPYLVSQEYGDGALRQHFDKELAKLASPFPGSLQAEAHPALLPPFSGTNTMTFFVRPQRPRQAPTDKMLVTYHFTVRTGVAVQVFNNNPGNGVDEVAITVVMNGNKYTMPSPVGRTDLIVKGGDLDSEGQVAINAIIAATALSYPGNVTCPTAMAACLTTSLYGAGIKTDSYPPLAATSPSDTQNVVTGRDITKPLPSSAGVSVDDSQPFPIYGSITAQWA